LILAGIEAGLTICAIYAAAAVISQGIFACRGVWAEGIHVGQLIDSEIKTAAEDALKKLRTAKALALHSTPTPKGAG
jgi:thiamine monophosphate synthase